MYFATKFLCILLFLGSAGIFFENSHHHHRRLFWKCPYLPRCARVRRFAHMKSSTHPWIPLIQDVNQAHSCHHPHTLSKPSYSSPSCPSHLYLSTQSSTLPRSRCPNHLNLPRLTTSAHLAPATSTFLPNHPHFHDPDAQTTSICHASPHPPHSVHPEDCTNPHCISGAQLGGRERGLEPPLVQKWRSYNYSKFDEFFWGGRGWGGG